jgi:hypothetical protein
MSTLTRKDRATKAVPTKHAVKKSKSDELKNKQMSELKESLTEAILIERGEIEAIPLSQLWNE